MVSAFWTSALRLKNAYAVHLQTLFMRANAKPCLTTDVVEILNKIDKTQIIQYLYHPHIRASVWKQPQFNFFSEVLTVFLEFCMSGWEPAKYNGSPQN